MNEKEIEMRNKLEEQFDALLEISKKCEPEHLGIIIDSMVKIYANLYLFR